MGWFERLFRKLLANAISACSAMILVLTCKLCCGVVVVAEDWWLYM